MAGEQVSADAVQAGDADQELFAVATDVDGAGFSASSPNAWMC
ncbi:MAG: hypothetical protein WCQ20_12855 [Synechococcaceae cyanobacterium ELA739]|jgi:hypothetical protein